MDSTRWRENEWNIVASQSNNYKENVHRRGHYFLRLWHPRDELHPPGMLAGAPYFISCCFQHADTLRWGYVSSLKWKYIVRVFSTAIQWTEKYVQDTCSIFFNIFYAELNLNKDFFKGMECANTMEYDKTIIFHSFYNVDTNIYIYIYTNQWNIIFKGDLLNNISFIFNIKYLLHTSIYTIRSIFRHDWWYLAFSVFVCLETFVRMYWDYYYCYYYYSYYYYVSL